MPVSRVATAVAVLTLLCVPLSTAAASSADAAVSAPPTPTIISEGDIRIANSIDDGQLTQRLVTVGTDEAIDELDLGSVVLAVAASEPWPGTSEDQASWERAAPGGSEVYRTRAGDYGVNGPRLSIDSNAIAPDAVFGDPVWGDSSGGVFSRLGTVAGPGHAAMLSYGTDFAGSSFPGSGAPTWLETSAPGGFLAEPQLPFALSFQQPGRYCVTLETMAQRNTDGSVLNHDITLTLAVGDIDPSTTEVCEQPTDIPTASAGAVQAVDDGTVVLDAGRARVSSQLDSGRLSLGIVTQDRGRATEHDPAAVVFSVPKQDTRWPGASGADTVWQLVAPVGSLLWRTIGYSADGELGERSNDLVLALEGGFIDASSLDESGAVSYGLRSVTAPTDGYVATYQTNGAGGIDDPASAAAWDSRPGGRNERLGAAGSDRDAGRPFVPIKPKTNDGTLGFAFSAAGVYCLTVDTAATLSDGTNVGDVSTLTFAVGVDASTVSPCAQDTDPTDPSDPTDSPDPTDPGGPELDPTVTWFDHGHLDLKAWVDDNGRFTLASIGDAYGGTPVSLDDSVWVANSRFTTFTVPEPDELQDLTFLGEPGDTYYGFSSSPTFVSTALWPGLNTQGLPAAYYDRAFTWTVDAVSGPGTVSVYAGARGESAIEYFDSRTLPASFTTGNSHVHENWSFTEPGVYCIDVAVTARQLGQTTDEIAAGRLTVAVGDVDLSTVQPCGRTVSAAETATPQTVADDAKTVITGGVTGRLTRVEVSLNDQHLDVAASTTTDVGSPRRVVDVDRVVWSFGSSGPTWHHLQEWSALPVPHGALRGDVTVTLGEVRGPGGYFVDETRLVGSSTPTLDTREGQELRQETVFPGRLTRMHQQFTTAGVYCVPYTWSAVAADGAPLAVTKVLTVAAGVDDPASVQLCSDGGEATPPDGGTDPEPPAAWDVPNHTLTASGDTIITDGHVDIASVVEDGVLQTVIKDDSDAVSGPVLRDPASVVLQLRPAAEASVPPQAAFSFLGEPGAPIWQVEQVQQEGLLWPGWSTERIDLGTIVDGVDWNLRAVDGPGHFALYETALGTPDVLFDSRDGVDAADTFTIPADVHAHGTWAFSSEGVYCLAFAREAALQTGATSRSEFVLTVAVGRVDVRAIDAAGCASGTPIQPGLPGTGGGETPSAGGSGDPADPATHEGLATTGVEPRFLALALTALLVGGSMLLLRARRRPAA